MRRFSFPFDVVIEAEYGKDAETALYKIMQDNGFEMAEPAIPNGRYVLVVSKKDL